MPADRDFAGDTRRTLKSFISTNLSGYLTDMTAYYNDGVPLPAIPEADIHTGLNMVDDANYFPFINIVSLDDRYESQAMGYDLYQTDISVWFVVKGYGASDQEEMISRYASSYRNMIRENYSLGGAVNEAYVETIQYIDFLDNIKAAKVKTVITLEIAV